MQLLLVDEASMSDDQFWQCIGQLLAVSQQGRRNAAHAAPDKFGQVHLLIFMDVKQLPPATCRPVFLVLPEIRDLFRVAMLRENRRVVDGGANRQQEIEHYHQVLDDMSRCLPTPAVRAFFEAAFLRGAMVTAKSSDYEGNTNRFSKRRSRDCTFVANPHRRSIV